MEVTEWPPIDNVLMRFPDFPAAASSHHSTVFTQVFTPIFIPVSPLPVSVHDQLAGDLAQHLGLWVEHVPDLQ